MKMAYTKVAQGCPGESRRQKIWRRMRLRTALFVAAMCGAVVYGKVVGRGDSSGTSGNTLRRRLGSWNDAGDVGPLLPGRRLEATNATAATAEVPLPGGLARYREDPKAVCANRTESGEMVPATERTCGTDAYGCTEYPVGIFTAAQCGRGLIMLHVIGLFYMFIGISVVCDEFFVPALEEMTFERMNLTPDVAGATFMAAGGSAPELATSFIGAFTESTVGFGTIVGSAVFNVLFVIGACAYYANEELVLTPYPLARDSTWYTLTLIALGLWFSILTPNEIHGWEAGVQFGMYLVYIYIMMRNGDLEHWFYTKFPMPDRGVDDKHFQSVKRNSISGIDPRDIPNNPASILPTPAGEGSNTPPTIAGVKSRAATPPPPRAGQVIAVASASVRPAEGTAMAVERAPSQAIAVGHNPQANVPIAVVHTRRVQNAYAFTFFEHGYFRTNFYRLLTGQRKLSDLIAFHAVSQIPGDVKKTFDQIDTEGTGSITLSNVEKLLRDLGDVKASKEAMEKYVAELDTDSSGDISFKEFKTWYKTSETRFRAEMENRFNELDLDKSGFIDQLELADLLTSLRHGHRPTSGEIRAVFDELDADGSGQVDRQEFCKWYMDGPMKVEKKLAEQAEEEDGIDLSWPSEGGAAAVFMYLFTLPLMLGLCYTVPDVRQEGKPWFWKSYKDLYPAGFVGSIVWIGIYSYLMVWFATAIGRTLAIPDEVMGLTFLAAGTSVPDLLTSVLVAMKGQGDMAVSSSIGSNIFDVTVGLPLPWLAYAAVKGKHVTVGAEGVGTSLVVLIVMLVAVICSIKACGWVMSKRLGAIMFGLYVLFVIQSLLLNTKLNWCISCQVLNF